MIGLLLKWDILYKIIVNTFSVSFWEESFLVVFATICNGDFFYLSSFEKEERRIKPKHIRNIVVCALIPAFISNIFRYTGADFFVYFSLTIASMYILLLFIYDWKSKVEYIVWGFCFLGFGILIVYLAELIYIPLILYSTRITVEQLNSNLLWNFITSLPERLIEGITISILLTKKWSDFKAKFIKPIIESKVLTIITLSTLIFNIGLLVLMGKLIAYNRILINLSLFIQLSVIIAVVIFPIINLFGLIWGIAYRGHQILSQQENEAK